MRQKEPVAREIIVCHVNLEITVYFVISYTNISDRSIVSTDFLPSFSLPSSFLSIYVALWVPFLCPFCS